jgi:hypothetical protein
VGDDMAVAPCLQEEAVEGYGRKRSPELGRMTPSTPAQDGPSGGAADLNSVDSKWQPDVTVI